MRSSKVFLVFRKDWREIRRNKEVLLPIVLLPLIISVILPLVFTFVSSISMDPGSSSDLDLILGSLPDYVKNEILEMTPNEALAYLMSAYLFAPLFLIIPVMASSVIASDSFAGEKERKTIEALLATPISDSELFLGKIMVSFIPSIIVTFASFSAYTAMVDLFYLQTFGRLILPNLSWIVLVFWLAPAIALTSIGLTVMVSSKVKGFREAQQISAVLMIPIIMLMIAQVSGVAFFGPVLLAAVGVACVMIDVAVFYAGVKTFRREEILSRLS